VKEYLIFVCFEDGSQSGLSAGNNAVALSHYPDLPSPEEVAAPIITVPQPSDSMPALTTAGRLRRHYRMPARYVDVPPEGPTPLPSIPVAPLPPVPSIRRVILHVRDCLQTTTNCFGLLREYPYRPSYDPDFLVSPEELSDRAVVKNTVSKQHTEQVSFSPPWPFENMSTYLLMEWVNTGSSKKSNAEVDRLVKEVIGAKEFRVDDLRGFNIQRENKRIDTCSSRHMPPFGHDGWFETDVAISIPTGVRDPNGKGATFSIPGFHHRSLLAVMKSALHETMARRFHFSPFRRLWRNPSGYDERVFDDTFTSDAWLEVHGALQKQANEPGCKLEKVVLGLMFWSDSTHLASFGTASVWPLYLYFANLSKYVRCRPTSDASHHVAYIPKVCLCSPSMTADLMFFKRFLIPFKMHLSVINNKIKRSPTAVRSSCKMSGTSYWMMSLWLHTSMALFLSAMMGFVDVSIHESSHTLQTTKKSKQTMRYLNLI
jgi:hypothetical protein